MHAFEYTLYKSMHSLFLTTIREYLCECSFKEEGHTFAGFIPNYFMIIALDIAMMAPNHE